MEQLRHFNHRHLLSLVRLQPEHNNENSETEEEDEEDFVVEQPCVGKCEICEEEIYSYHLCYYSCKDCDYSLHKTCAQLPRIRQNHPLHPGHTLRLRFYYGQDTRDRKQRCNICLVKRLRHCMYQCFDCDFGMDMVCTTMSEQKIDHPSHPHQLQRHFRPMVSLCNACGDEHSGTFYNCTTCSCFSIHLNCALLPAKLQIQKSTNETFSHSHSLTLAYSFPLYEKREKFFPKCRVCEKGFDPNYIRYESSYLWHYRCDKCRYYVHVDCATSMKEAFMSSILMPAGMGKTYKNYKDEDHPNLIHYPYPDESANLLREHFINKGQLVNKEKIDGDIFSHPHLMILVDTLHNEPGSFHDPMKKVEVLRDGCVRPVTEVPFYKCSEQNCSFVLHEWCTRLPPEIQNHPGHPEHTLVLFPKVPGKLLGAFRCRVCWLYCNGFAYGCMQCKYYVDIHCGFMPSAITHEAHPNHILFLKFNASNSRECKSCKFRTNRGFHCPTCDFFLDPGCALLLPRTVRHKYDKHPLRLSYFPAENHSNEYFCEICEDILNPTDWFYHCNMCASSMHTTCASLKIQYEMSESESFNDEAIFEYLNVKFGGIHEIRYHQHPLTFVVGINDGGKCMFCDYQGLYKIMLKCVRCEFVLHHKCWKMLIQGFSKVEHDSS